MFTKGIYFSLSWLKFQRYLYNAEHHKIKGAFFDLLYRAPREKIKSLNYNIAGVTPVQTAKELEMVIKKFVSGFQVTYKPNPKLMEFFRNFNGEVYDDGRARKEWGWKSRYPDFEMVVTDFLEEVRRNPERYGI